MVDDDLGANPLTLAEVLVVPARTGRLDTLLSVLRDIDVQALPFPTDTAVQLAELRADTGLKMPDCCVLLRRQKRERTSRRSTLGSRRRPKRAVCPFSGADLTTSHLWPIFTIRASMLLRCNSTANRAPLAVTPHHTVAAAAAPSTTRRTDVSCPLGR